ncbi:hypothetical protein [Adhaeribacter soli]|uniref:Nucleoside 2-deoxyribosyltransferase n=1 Tax=Adhaeribacter soli TaxID=2607655 RepID=A0A5N1J1S0_9BACT|nr:hypothetical protein [Adhaeribacter soli]KAA9340733.1 hypothetical protein F0P94_04715 [Adhaeribacter soli]
METAILPKTPQEKLNTLLLYFYNRQTYAGEFFDQRDLTGNDGNWKELEYLSNREALFYLNTLITKGLIQRIPEWEFKITFDGLNYALQLTEEGLNSTNCFVAMSFDEDDKPIFEDGIVPALTATGFRPFIVNKEHLEPEQTINDGIIAGIKKSKFIIADFTKQKDGVYFEAGYALGRGLKVIYTCRRDWFSQCHFDINHFPHLIYETPAQLRYGLINKIEAWIK